MEIAFILIAGAIGYLGFKLKYTRPKYQFERTTTGRTIKFLDYNESKKRVRLKIYGILMISLSIMILGMGFIIKFFIMK